MQSHYTKTEPRIEELEKELQETKQKLVDVKEY